MVNTITPCANFITGSTNKNGVTPSASCCDSLVSLISTNVDCACLLITANVPLQLPVNTLLAVLSLPQACNVNQMSALCKGPSLLGSNGQTLPPIAVSPLSPQGLHVGQLYLAAITALAFCMGDTETEEDPELTTCKHQCQQQSQYTEHDKQTCIQRCDRYHYSKQKREKQIQEEGKEQESQQEGDEKEDENPYVFDESSFDTKVETDGGRIRLLQKFTEKSKLLQGIENFRLAIVEAKAHTFMPPRHFDSEVVLFIMQGQAVLGLVRESETEKFSLEAGDMLRIPAGTPLYIANRDENEKLFLAMLHIPISTSGKFEEFFGPGGQDPESVLSAFGWNVLQSALQESMSTIHYNSHATKIALVINGTGHLQIACPHLSSKSESEHEKSSPSYHRISSKLKPGTVFVVPPGHPFVTMASRKENLLIICFEINARENKKFTFAGKDNIVSSLDNVAKELAFNYPAHMVNGVFDRKEKFFFPFVFPSKERGLRADA
ncbi:hypothetical protein Fmac_027907 [Flemingia macrophylla]|uniref:Cupin type-1 domain-containing protein n=1 Tax=Flemingia macrophylla TaxID=520843 RepID=A0ABD1LJ97_9FABA